MDIFKFNDNVYSIGKLEFSVNFVKDLAKILSLGPKFVPLPMYNRYLFFKKSLSKKEMLNETNKVILN